MEQKYNLKCKIGTGAQGAVWLCTSKEDPTKEYAVKFIDCSSEEELDAVVNQIESLFAFCRAEDEAELSSAHSTDAENPNLGNGEQNKFSVNSSNPIISGCLGGCSSDYGKFHDLVVRHYEYMVEKRESFMDTFRRVYLVMEYCNGGTLEGRIRDLRRQGITSLLHNFNSNSNSNSDNNTSSSSSSSSSPSGSVVSPRVNNNNSTMDTNSSGSSTDSYDGWLASPSSISSDSIDSSNNSNNSGLNKLKKRSSSKGSKNKNNNNNNNSSSSSSNKSMDLSSSCNSSFSQTFSFRLRDNAPLEEEFLSYAEQLARCLAKLHSMKIIHRDIKPDNCLLFSNNHSNHNKTTSATTVEASTPETTTRSCADDDAQSSSPSDPTDSSCGCRSSNRNSSNYSRLKLCDFGFTKEIRMAKASTFVGTPTYMAPEILQRQTYGEMADIWSYGIVLLQMLMLQSSNTMPDIRQKLTADPNYIIKTALEKDWNETLATLAIKCCNLDPQARPSAAYLVNFFEIQKERQLLMMQQQQQQHHHHHHYHYHQQQHYNYHEDEEEAGSAAAAGPSATTSTISDTMLTPLTARGSSSSSATSSSMKEPSPRSRSHSIFPHLHHHEHHHHHHAHHQHHDSQQHHHRMYSRVYNRETPKFLTTPKRGEYFEFLDETYTFTSGRRNTMRYSIMGVGGGTPVVEMLYMPMLGHKFAHWDTEAAVKKLGIVRIAFERHQMVTNMTKFDYHGFAQCLAEFMDHLEIHRFALLGGFIGGPLAVSCAYYLPDRVSAVGLWSSMAGDSSFIRGLKPKLSKADQLKLEIFSSLSTKVMKWLMKHAFSHGKHHIKARKQAMKAYSRNPFDAKAVEDGKICDLILAHMDVGKAAGAAASDEIASMLQSGGCFERQHIDLTQLHTPVVAYHSSETDVARVMVPFDLTNASMYSKMPNVRVRTFDDEGTLSVYCNRYEELLADLVQAAAQSTGSATSGSGSSGSNCCTKVVSIPKTIFE